MSSAASRRIKPKIKAPKRHGPDISIEETWSKLSENIREIHSQNAAKLSFEENHRFGYNMVLYRSGEMLYKGVCNLVTENIDNLANNRIVPVFPTNTSDDPIQNGQEGETLLKAIRSVWDEHTSNMSKLRDILRYMDRVYTKSAGVPEIYDAGLNIFHKRIIRPPIKDHMVSTILRQVRIERDGFPINRSAVKGCVDVLLELRAGGDGPTVYVSELEPVFLRESKEFYEKEGDHLLQTCDAPEYLRRVSSRLDSENDRTAHYLSSLTTPALRSILEEHLITANLISVISMSSGLDSMIDLDRIDDLGRMYTLFMMVPTGLPELCRALRKSIVRRGKEINQNALGLEVEGNAQGAVEESNEKDSGKGKSKAGNAAQGLTVALKWVQDVLDLKDKLEEIWRQAFRNNRDIEGTFTEAFEDFINRIEKSPEFISLFIDENLKKGLKGKTDNEVDIVLDKTITVFRYLREKDVFERYYKGHLAKRLLLGRSVSDDAERGMLAKLKIECGYQFTQKLEGMFNDMKVSSDTMEAYRRHLSNSSAPEIELSVIVMTATFWPMSHATSPTCVLPQELIRCCRSYESFYFTRHSGRRLTWQPSLGNADVRVAFKNRTHDLNVSTFALVILLLFRDLTPSDVLTYEDIKTATEIPDQELRRQLQSLACAKYKILKKHPPGRDVDSSDSFSFNYDFSSPLQKIKVVTISSKVESADESKETRSKIDDDRRFQTEAAIVRIMKARQTMTHNELVNETTRQLSSRFQPDANLIKRRIEGLIERDYLERTEDRKSYRYLA